jgi:hypothetical protein
MFRQPPFAGVTHLHNCSSVPSIGGVPSLTAALAAVERAEAALEAARIQARKAARREGTSTRGLFENSRYILRASGEKWVDEARLGLRVAVLSGRDPGQHPFEDLDSLSVAPIRVAFRLQTIGP